MAASSKSSSNIRVFISYSHQDVTFRNKLVDYLFGQSSDFEILSDDLLRLGDDWPKLMDALLAQADIFLLLVSLSYLHSDTVREEYLKIIARHDRDGATIIPVIIAPCDWQSLPFGRFQAVPKNGRPILEFSDEGQAYTEIALAVAMSVNLKRNQRATQLIEEEFRKKTGKLNLSKCELTNVPSDILQMTWLRELRLDGNEISRIANLEKLGELERLDLSHNTIARIENISQLRKLKFLDLGYNTIGKIDNLGSLGNLEVLELHHNHIERIQNLTNNYRLRYLGLSYNEITTLSNISHLRSLRELRIRHNGLRTLTGLGRLQALERAVLTSNELTSLKPMVYQIGKGLPVSLDHKFDDSKGIFIADNKTLVEPPYEVIETGSYAILRYFQDLENYGGSNIEILKLILVGNSRSGKSNFSEFMRLGQITRDNPSTHLLDIQRWRAPFLKKDGIPNLWINIFDFGGQDYYHDAHRMFYSHDTAYVLLWEQTTNLYQEVGHRGKDTGYENFPLSYWLESINYKLRTGQRPDREVPPEGKAPVLLIQNKIDIEEGKLDQMTLCGHYPNIWGFYNVSLEKKMRTDVLGEVLEQYIDSLPLSGRTLTAYQVPVIKHFLENNDLLNIYTIAKFAQVCTELADPSGFSFSEEDAFIIARILNNMGLVYHDQYGTGPGTVYTHIGQLNALIKKVMDLAKKSQEKGGFKKEQLSPFTYREEVLALLCKNNSIIEVRPGVYLAPQFLPVQPEAGVRFFQSNFTHEQVRFVYRAYFHKSLLLSLFAKYVKGMLTDADTDVRNLPFWRNGLIVSRGTEENKQMVLLEFEKTPQEGIIHVRTMKLFSNSGLEKDIVDTLAELSEGWTVEKEISVNSQDFFKVSELRGQLAKRQFLFYCKDYVFGINEFKSIETFENLPKKLFISYSSKNAEFIKRFVTHLQVLKANGDIEPWYDRMIESGTRWDEAIRAEMAASDVVIFLLSPDFLATEYIMKTEIPMAIERFGPDTSKFFFIELQPCGWQRTIIAQFQQTDDADETKKNILNVGKPDDDGQWVKVIDELVDKMKEK